MIKERNRNSNPKEYSTLASAKSQGENCKKCAGKLTRRNALSQTFDTVKGETARKNQNTPDGKISRNALTQGKRRKKKNLNLKLHPFVPMREIRKNARKRKKLLALAKGIAEGHRKGTKSGEPGKCHISVSEILHRRTGGKNE